MSVKNPTMADRIQAAAVLVQTLAYMAECNALSYPQEDGEAEAWNELAERLRLSVASLEATVEFCEAAKAMVG